MGNPADVLREARERKAAQWWEGRRWRVADEVTGQRTDGDVSVLYQNGHVTVSGPGKLKTPLGHTGKNGYMVAEIDAAGQDTGVYVIFGLNALRNAQKKYGAIVGLESAEED